MQKKSTGFTLIEVLVVIGILGIILAFGLRGVLREQQVQQLRAAQNQLGTDIERARSFARRYSYNYQFTLTNATGAYTIQPRNTANVVVTTAPSVTGRLPSPIRVLSTTPASTTTYTLSYSGPFGRLVGASSASIRIGFGPATGQLKTSVDMIGVTGQVIRRGISE
jgi:prepilin-type N-terminal cleavage/methylation domain-containing protein